MPYKVKVKRVQYADLYFDESESESRRLTYVAINHDSNGFRTNDFDILEFEKITDDEYLKWVGGKQ